MQIYKITNKINNKIYIGKDTTSDPDYFGSGLLINRALEKYGRENFRKEIIDTTDDYNELSSKEIYWISEYKSTDREIGYNISPGGNGGDTLSNHPDLDIIKDKISRNNPKTGKTYEEAFGEEMSERYKDKLRKNTHKNILSPKIIEAKNKKWEDYNDKFKIRCEFIKDEIEKCKFSEYEEELRQIKKRVYNNFLKNVNGFYNFFGEELKYIFGKLKVKRSVEFGRIDGLVVEKDIDGLISYIKKIPNSFFDRRYKFYEYIGEYLKLEIKIKLKENSKEKNKDKIRKFNSVNKVEIIIDNIEYDSISDATRKLNIYRALIVYRLKSSHFKNYIYKNNDLNIKYNKFINIDSYLNKKEKISINEIEYNSIAEACHILNKSDSYISWRLNSKSYPNWFYINKKVELKETGPIKNKPVSINGVIYESIAKAVEGSGIDRQIMRYRLKSNNYINYFYI